MSFRGRLTLFFLLIVVLPMIAVAVLVTQVTSKSGSGKADARLASSMDAALALYRDDVTAARRAAGNFASDPDLVAALRSGDPATIQGVAPRVAQGNGIRALEIRDPGGHRLAKVGGTYAVAAYRLKLRGPGGPLGTLIASTTTPSAYLDQMRHITGREGAVLSGNRPLAATVGVRDVSLPASGHSMDVEVAGEKMRAATADLPGPGALRLALLGPVTSGGFFSSSPLVAAALAVFFAVALVFVAMLLRALGGQVEAMLDAARGIGEGDFSRKVPVVGNDEMAGLASEFNKMSDRLSAQMEELRRQQMEIDRSVRRIGEAFASGLDRQAMLEVIVETALGACGARYGTIALTGRAGAEAEAGDPSGRLQDVAVAAEGEAMRRGDIVGLEDNGVCALATPLRRLGEPAIRVGAMTVARGGKSFTPRQREVFLYLAGQVSSSIENIALHEQVSEQAVTDELTGLSNYRRFRELISKEGSRAQRFGHDLSLVMLDIDDFKQINDTYGHLQGDEVLRMVGRVLDSVSRGIDEPARYGGEEFAVALPETGLEGAVDFGERVRAKIEAQRVPRTRGSGTVRVTASVGAASLPGSADDAQALIAAADAALFEAKRAGKNRVASASARRAADRA
ncbi:MAG TPA: GGDEF domain-containing protein [Solirubrobacterales bacterium]|nr:GGDEF domain-containing protein [Solirubrobacterales bacterium]